MSNPTEEQRLKEVNQLEQILADLRQFYLDLKSAGALSPFRVKALEKLTDARMAIVVALEQLRVGV